MKCLSEGKFILKKYIVLIIYTISTIMDFFIIQVYLVKKYLSEFLILQIKKFQNLAFELYSLYLDESNDLLDNTQISSLLKI